MPNRNGTGPQSQGPKTGRGLGSCQSADQSALTPNLNRGQCLGCGRGRGRGLGRQTN